MLINDPGLFSQSSCVSRQQQQLLISPRLSWLGALIRPGFTGHWSNIQSPVKASELKKVRFVLVSALLIMQSSFPKRHSDLSLVLAAAALLPFPQQPTDYIAYNNTLIEFFLPPRSLLPTHSLFKPSTTIFSLRWWERGQTFRGVAKYHWKSETGCVISKRKN